MNKTVKIGAMLVVVFLLAIPVTGALATRGKETVATEPHFLGQGRFNLNASQFACGEAFPNNDSVSAVKCQVGTIQEGNIISQSTSGLGCDYEGGHCYYGYYYDTSGPYTGAWFSGLVATAAPGGGFTTYFSSFWIGLQNNVEGNNSVLVQSGIAYGAPNNDDIPIAFTEIIGNFYNGSTYCAEGYGFCGTYTPVSVGSNITFGEYYSDGVWYAYFYDLDAPFTTMSSMATSADLGGATTLPIAVSTFEGYNLYSSIGLPSLPVTATGIELYNGSNPNTDHVSININDWKSYSSGLGGRTSIPMDTFMTATPSETWGKLNPTVSTALSLSLINTGGSVSDSATLSGTTSNAGGSVTFYYSTTNSCPYSGATDVSSVTVSNGVPSGNSQPVTFNTAGTYYWYAKYSGDSLNNEAWSPCEVLTVNEGGGGCVIAANTGALSAVERDVNYFVGLLGGIFDPSCIGSCNPC